MKNVWQLPSALALGFLILSGPAAEAAPLILQNFPGIDFTNSNCGCLPPDSSGGVSPTQVTEMVNTAFAVYNRSGTLLAPIISQNTFWANAGVAGGAGDARVLYDSSSGRWFAIGVGRDFAHVTVARSDGSDATGGWKGVAIPTNLGGLPDIPSISVDANAINITFNNFGNSGVTAEAYSIPKADFVAATPSLANISSFTGLDITTYGWRPQPFQAGFLATDPTATGRLVVTPLNGTGAAGATLGSPIAIGVQDGDPVRAAQPGLPGSVETNSHDLFGNVARVGNLLYATNSITDGTGRDVVHWVIIDTLTNTLLHEGTIGDPGFDFYYPSIAANASGNFLLAFNRSGGSAPDGYIGSYAESCVLSLGVTCGSPFLLEPGVEANNFSFRWGDYSTTVIDPTDPLAFWTFQEIAPAGSDTNIWATQITEIGIDRVAAPEPVTLALLGVGLAGLGFGRRKKV